MCEKCGCGADLASEIARICAGYHNDKRYLIPVLHDTQDKLGWVSPAAMEAIADGLGITIGKVHGVATFYTLFYTSPRGKHIVRICDSPPCHIEGSKGIKQAVTAQIGIKPGETTDDSQFTFEVVSCMGLCGVSPAMMVNDEVFGNLTPDMVPAILARYKEVN
jgi:NADH:ubiquinone oxidoreductase subunit E